MVQVLHSSGHGHGPPGHKCDHGHDHGDEGHDHAHDHGDGGHDHAHDHAHDHNHDHDHDHGHGHGTDGHNHDHDHDHGHGHGHDHDHGDSKTKDTGEKNLSKISASENANIRAAFIHILGDILQSVGVVIAAIVIKIKPEWHIIDPICTIVFAIIVSFTAWSVIKSCVYLLMESVPEDLNIEEFEKEIIGIHGVEDVHDLHVWNLTHGKPAMTAHIRGRDGDYILKKATIISRKYGIYHSTIQIDSEQQSVKGGKYYIDCGQNVH